MTRRHLIQQLLRQVYNGFPTDDSNITENLVNQLVNQGIGIAAKQNYVESVKLDGVGYVNNAFYTTFKGLSVTKDENFLWKITLPEIPVGIGRNEDISTLQFKDAALNQLSLPAIPISQAQKGYHQSLKPIPNKILYYDEGNEVYVVTSIILSEYTATVTMLSGGDSTDLDSVLRVPEAFIPVISEYVIKQLLLEKSQMADGSNDGTDNK